MEEGDLDHRTLGYDVWIHFKYLNRISEKVYGLHNSFNSKNKKEVF